MRTTFQSAELCYVVILYTKYDLTCLEHLIKSFSLYETGKWSRGGPLKLEMGAIICANCITLNLTNLLFCDEFPL